MELLLLILLGFIGQLLHVGVNLRARLQAFYLDNSNTTTEFSWKTWWQKNWALSSISLLLVVLFIVVQFIMYPDPFLTREMAFGIGYMFDSFLKEGLKSKKQGDK